MQITSSRIQRPMAQTQLAPQAKSEPGPQDQVTFGSSNNSLGGALFFGVGGAIPLVGFATNFGIGAQAGVNDAPTASAAAGFGALANLVGTGTTVLGLTFGSGLTTKIGLGLLGGSAAAGAFAGFVAS
jgi:hypothetical protein